MVVAVAAGFTFGARSLTGGHPTDAAGPAEAKATTKAKPPVQGPRALPREMRGVHVTVALASLRGKVAEWHSDAQASST